MMKKLGTDALFPKVTLDLVDGSSLSLPNGMGGKYNVILFFRGHW